MQQSSPRFGHNRMVGLPSSQSRVRFAALQNARALDCCGRQTRSSGYDRNGLACENVMD